MVDFTIPGWALPECKHEQPLLFAMFSANETGSALQSSVINFYINKSSSSYGETFLGLLLLFWWLSLWTLINHYQPQSPVDGS